MNIVENVRESDSLESYITKLGFQWKNEGSGKDLSECPVCGGHHCFKLSVKGFVKCFQCQLIAFDIIQFRAFYENIYWKESLEKFIDELNIKKYKKNDIDWIGIRETACEIGRDILNSCQTKYLFRGENITPMYYLTDIRKHSYDAIAYFRLGFNDGSLIERLKEKYSYEIIKTSGLTVIQNGIFMYPFLVNNDIQYFRLKDPNKIRKAQMPTITRNKNAVWYNQDILKEAEDLWAVEGEDNVISLWDYGQNVIGCCGSLSQEQINYLKINKKTNCVIYSAFDNDPIKINEKTGKMRQRAGENYTKKIISEIKDNLFLIDIPAEKDIDDLIKETESPEDLILSLKKSAKEPPAELRILLETNIVETEKGYFINKFYSGTGKEIQLTNWIGSVEAIIIKDEGVRERKVKIKCENYQTTVFMDGTILSSASKFREFLLNNCNTTCLFQGTENDLNKLVQYWGVIYSPIIVKETECVGEIDEGFIADNVFIDNNNNIKPLVDGYLQLDEKESIKIAEITTQAGERSQIPYYPLNEPHGGIIEFKNKVFDMLIKNRNLKVAIAIGWMKSTLWSKLFFKKNRFFPILMIHGKTRSGKTRLSEWLMSMMGMRDVQSTSLDEKRSRSVGIERKLSYYSSLPILAEDYKCVEGEGMLYHGLFRNVFDRTSAPKGIKNNAVKIRNVIIRGCLIINGETATNNDGLNSRLITFEFTENERNDKYWYDIIDLEPDFAYIGFDWIKNKNKQYNNFIDKYNKLEKKFKKDIGSPRQAQVWAVAIASALTEPYFLEQEEKLINYAIKLANHEINEQKSEEVIGTLWEATDILKRLNKTTIQVITYDFFKKEVHIHLSMLLGLISGESATRKYKLPNVREVSKILKQEPYCAGNGQIKVDGKNARRWIIDFTHPECPEILRNMFDENEVEKVEEELDL